VTRESRLWTVWRDARECRNGLAGSRERNTTLLARMRSEGGANAKRRTEDGERRTYALSRQLRQRRGSRI
jgi:hypothetical protein